MHVRVACYSLLIVQGPASSSVCKTFIFNSVLNLHLLETYIRLKFQTFGRISEYNIHESGRQFHSVSLVNQHILADLGQRDFRYQQSASGDKTSRCQGPRTELYQPRKGTLLYAITYLCKGKCKRKKKYLKSNFATVRYSYQFLFQTFQNCPISSVFFKLLTIMLGYHYIYSSSET